MDEERRQSDLNREVIRKVEEAWSKGYIDALVGVFAPDVKSHSQLPA